MFRLIGIVLVLMITAAVSAQDTVPFESIGSVEAGDFRALAVTGNGARLLIADAENDQLRVYNFADPTAPAIISSVDLDGEPVALAATERFALVAVSTPDAGDAVRVIAPSRYSRPQGYAEISSLDVPDGVMRLTLSPDNNWALAVGSGGYTLLELLSASEINSLPVEFDLVDAAVNNNTAFLLSETQLVTESLAANVARTRVGQMEFEGTARRIALDPRGAFGVIVLGDSTLFLFNPTTLETISLFEAGGAAINDVQFVTAQGGTWLALTRAGSSDITLLDVNDPPNVSARDPLSTGFETPIQAMTTFNGLIIATDGQTVRIFQS